MAKYNNCCVQFYFVYKYAIIQPYLILMNVLSTQCRTASSFSVYSVAILARLDMKISEMFSHREKYLRYKQEDLLHLLMENRHWDQELQGKEGMRPLKLLPKFMEPQMTILQPLTRDCLTETEVQKC